MKYENILLTRKAIEDRYSISSTTVIELDKRGAFGETFVVAQENQIPNIVSTDKIKGNIPHHYSLEALKNFELARCKNPETYEFKPDGSFIPVEEALAFLGYSKGTELKFISKTVMDIANPINIGTLEKTYWRFRTDLLEEARKYRRGQTNKPSAEPVKGTAEEAMFELFKKFMDAYKKENEGK